MEWSLDWVCLSDTGLVQLLEVNTSSYSLMSKQELKALLNGIKLNKKLCAYYGLPLPSQLRQVQLDAEQCLPTCKGSLPHSAKLYLANAKLEQSNPSNPTPPRVSFDPKLKYSGTQRRHRNVYNAHAVLLSWQSCCSLKEILLHQNLYD